MDGKDAFGESTFAKMKSRAWDEDLDCEGLLCPLPVLRARKRLIAMVPGQVLRVRATDAMAAVDLPHFCLEAGHAFLGGDVQDGVATYLIRRGRDLPGQ